MPNLLSHEKKNICPVAVCAAEKKINLTITYILDFLPLQKSHSSLYVGKFSFARLAFFIIFPEIYLIKRFFFWRISAIFEMVH